MKHRGEESVKDDHRVSGWADWMCDEATPEKLGIGEPHCAAHDLGLGTVSWKGLWNNVVGRWVSKLRLTESITMYLN